MCMYVSVCARAWVKLKKDKKCLWERNQQNNSSSRGSTSNNNNRDSLILCVCDNKVEKKNTNDFFFSSGVTLLIACYSLNSSVKEKQNKNTEKTETETEAIAKISTAKNKVLTSKANQEKKGKQIRYQQRKNGLWTG